MKQLITIIIVLVYSICKTMVYSQKAFDPYSFAKSHFEEQIKFKQGKVFGAFVEYEIYKSRLTYQTVNYDIYEFVYINSLALRQNLVASILKKNNLYKDTALIKRLEVFDTSCVNLYDSIILNYLGSNNIDSMIQFFLNNTDKAKLYKNENTAYNIAIIAYSKQINVFYELLGFDNNDFKSFFYSELLPSFYLNPRAMDYELRIYEKLDKIDSGSVKFRDFYNVYVKDNHCKELYPILFIITTY